ncbi:MAG: plastocyanin/azurin family copper-binding protein [Candidatus Acidiferrum sp.]
MKATVLGQTRYSFLKLFLLLTIALIPGSIQAETWQARVGAQSFDKSQQVLGFLPNEMWIHAGDNIVWTFNSDETHTITFLQASQIRPAFTVGCPGFIGGSATFDGSACISTPPLASGQAFTVIFPKPGNYKLVCLVHADMAGVIHVLDASDTLPHDQDFYDREATREQIALLFSAAVNGESEHERHDGSSRVVAGHGIVLATGGGHDTVSRMRFGDEKIVIHAGETVEWTNNDPSTPHTITFGVEPVNTRIPSTNVSIDADGALHAAIVSSTDNVHSGFIVSAPQDRTGLPQSPIGTTRFRVTFSTAGTFPYICALHDELGMKGTIVVLP